MHYASTVPFEGNTEKAFDLAAAALTSIGFRIEGRDRTSLDLSGPGMNSTRQSALMGASRIQVTRGARELSMKAELGGVRSMTRFVTLFPIALSVLLALILSATFAVGFEDRAWLIPLVIITAANVLLWLGIGPLMARWIHDRTHRSLDALLHNMAMMAREV